jgi:hypothetical protein
MIRSEQRVASVHGGARCGICVWLGTVISCVPFRTSCSSLLTSLAKSHLHQDRVRLSLHKMLAHLAFSRPICWDLELTLALLLDTEACSPHQVKVLLCDTLCLLSSRV